MDTSASSSSAPGYGGSGSSSSSAMALSETFASAKSSSSVLSASSSLFHANKEALACQYCDEHFDDGMRFVLDTTDPQGSYIECIYCPDGDTMGNKKDNLRRLYLDARRGSNFVSNLNGHIASKSHLLHRQQPRIDAWAKIKQQPRVDDASNFA